MKISIIYSSLILSAFLFGCSTSQENTKADSITTEVQVSGKMDNSESTETTKVEGTLRFQDGSPSVSVLGTPLSPLFVKVYYVQGSVKSPGQFTWQEGISVSGAISLAGGFESEAKSLSLTTRGKVINLGSIFDLSSDPPIQAGDIIKVNSSSN